MLGTYPSGRFAVRLRADRGRSLVRSAWPGRGGLDIPGAFGLATRCEPGRFAVRLRTVPHPRCVDRSSAAGKSLEPSRLLGRYWRGAPRSPIRSCARGRPASVQHSTFNIEQPTAYLRGPRAPGRVLLHSATSSCRALLNTAWMAARSSRVSKGFQSMKPPMFRMKKSYSSFTL